MPWPVQNYPSSHLGLELKKGYGFEIKFLLTWPHLCSACRSLPAGVKKVFYSTPHLWPKEKSVLGHSKFEDAMVTTGCL